MGEHVVRPLADTDRDAARALAHATYGGTRYLARTLELLGAALARDPECRGFVAIADEGSLTGLMICGPVGGAAGVIKVGVLLGASVSLTGLLAAASRVDSAEDARLMFCELAVSRENAVARDALIAFGFRCEASIADYFADGITLDVLVRRS